MSRTWCASRRRSRFSESPKAWPRRTSSRREQAERLGGTDEAASGDHVMPSQRWYRQGLTQTLGTASTQSLTRARRLLLVRVLAAVRRGAQVLAPLLAPRLDHLAARGRGHARAIARLVGALALRAALGAPQRAPAGLHHQRAVPKPLSKLVRPRRGGAQRDACRGGQHGRGAKSQPGAHVSRRQLCGRRGAARRLPPGRIPPRSRDQVVSGHPAAHRARRRAPSRQARGVGAGAAPGLRLPSLRGCRAATGAVHRAGAPAGAPLPP